jgi:hypothetical protein
MRPELQRPPQVPDTLTPADQLLAAGIGVGAAAGGLVWASGQLAGLVFAPKARTIWVIARQARRPPPDANATPSRSRHRWIVWKAARR